jgi:Protein of unknown function (DUF3592)
MIPLILPAITILICAALCAWEWRMIVLGRAAMSWPRTEGFIADARFNETIVQDDDDAMYSAHLVFAYTVRGRRYRSRRFTYRQTRGLTQSAAYALLRGIRRGQIIDVYYDPKRPERAVVLPGIDRSNLVAFWFWCVGGLAAIWWLAAVWTAVA